jgi:hypothetical protein
MLTAIPLRNASILKCTLCTRGGGRHKKGEILKDNNVLINVLSTLRVGDTLVPFILMFDGIHLLNFAGNKKEWRIYMTIGNLSSKIRQTPSMHSVVMVAL